MGIYYQINSEFKKPKVHPNIRIQYLKTTGKEHH